MLFSGQVSVAAADGRLLSALERGLVPRLDGQPPSLSLRTPEGQLWYGWGEAVVAEASGPERFSQLDSVWREWCSPERVAFFRAAFEDDLDRDTRWGELASAALIVPEYFVRFSPGEGAAMGAQGAADIPSAERWQVAEPRELPRCHKAPADVDDNYAAIVAKALEVLAGSAIKKVVLSRTLDSQLAQIPEPDALLPRMYESQPGSWSLHFKLDDDAVFYAATPEILVSTQGSTLETMALAGSKPRADLGGGSGAELLDDPKEMAEHLYVSDAIIRDLGELGVESFRRSKPRLRELPYIVHIQTDISAELPAHIGAISVAGKFHPTPAVGGSPWPDSRELLRELEGVPRGLYAGVVGVLDNNTALMLVALRCALQRGDRWITFGGAGIVEGSKPLREVRETGEKMRPMLDLMPS